MPNFLPTCDQFSKKTAIVDASGSYTFGELKKNVLRWSYRITDGTGHLDGKRVAFCVQPGFEYVSILWAIWLTEGIAVPLNPKAPITSHEYSLKDSSPSSFICDSELTGTFSPVLEKMGVPVLSADDAGSNPLDPPEIADESLGAMMLYTSGTTGNPKGVLTTHQNIQSQINSLVNAWEWTSSDHTINVLPLHHVHGIINVVNCSLSVGATCEFLTFDEHKLFEKFLEGHINVFMAVPTIYHKLLRAYEQLSPEIKSELEISMSKMRLMVSGSAALPVSVLEKWQELSGHTLLERYGMTEIGMAISNPYQGQRLPGFIGQPLPGVEVQLINDEGQIIREEEESGEIQVKGPSIFKEYWNKPEATREAFTEDGWFKTGDVAMVQQGSYKILGRKSADIIKSGGYKLSALEIEESIRTYPNIQDCAVVGIADEEWGEIVAAAVQTDAHLDTNSIKAYLREKLPGYKVPRNYIVVDQLPRNAMGKVVKKDVKKLFEE